MLPAAEAKAASIVLPTTSRSSTRQAICWHSYARTARSSDLVIDKATTARLFDRSTAELANLSQPGELLFGIDQSNAGKVVIFGGGIPATIGGRIVGAVGTSAGTVEQDIAVAEAALAALSI